MCLTFTFGNFLLELTVTSRVKEKLLPTCTFTKKMTFEALTKGIRAVWKFEYFPPTFYVKLISQQKFHF